MLRVVFPCIVWYNNAFKFEGFWFVMGFGGGSGKVDSNEMLPPKRDIREELLVDRRRKQWSHFYEDFLSIGDSFDYLVTAIGKACRNDCYANVDYPLNSPRVSESDIIHHTACFLEKELGPNYSPVFAKESDGCLLSLLIELDDLKENSKINPDNRLLIAYVDFLKNPTDGYLKQDFWKLRQGLL